MIQKFRYFLLIFLLIPVLTACNFGLSPSNPGLRVRVLADGRELALTATDSISVSQFLTQNNITLGDLDVVDPPVYTQVTDNMTITITRVREETICADQAIPYDIITVPKQDLKPDEIRKAQEGKEGTIKVCSTVLYNNDVEKSRTQGSQTIVVTPQSEIDWKGFAKPEPIAVVGRLVYLSDNQGRLIEANSQNDHPLPTGTNLDGFVFTLASDGKALLFTAKPDAATPASTGDVFNTLYILLDISDPNAVPIRLFDNILTADWVPGQADTFSYSTLTPRDQLPGYQALNDLYTARFDPKAGKIVKANPLVKSGPTGVYGAWGTNFRWSPDGKQIAWAQADGVGLVKFDNNGKNGKLEKLLDFPVYSTTLSLNWVWKPTLSWSPDSSLIATTIHGKQLESEPQDTSPVFDLTVAQSSGLFAVPMVGQSGMWAAPTYSPLLQDSNGNQFGYIAYMRARTPINSVSSEYDLVIANRDGSNATLVFPPKDQPGLKPINNRFGDVIVWQPVDAQQVLVIHQGDLWAVDISSGQANRITYTGNANHPQWVK